MKGFEAMEEKKNSSADREVLGQKAREFRARFDTEGKCRQFLFEQRWPKGYQCPKRGCGHFDYYHHRTRDLYQCKKCGHQTSVIAGTMFEKTRTPLRDWFTVIFLTTQRMTKLSTRSIQKILGERYRNKYELVLTMRQKIEDELSAERGRGILTFYGLVEPKDLIIMVLKMMLKRKEEEEKWLKEATKAVKRDFRKMGLIKNKKKDAKKLPAELREKIRHLVKRNKIKKAVKKALKKKH
jgi:transposase-like protein